MVLQTTPNGAVMGSPVSPVIANIYMEYFEELTLGPQCPIPTPWWKRYVDDNHLHNQKSTCEHSI